MSPTPALPLPSTFLYQLGAAVAELDRMRAAAINEGCPMLALTLQLARDEAAGEIARRTPKKRHARRLPENVIRFPRKRLTKRRNAKALADCADVSTGQVLSLADHRH